MPRTLLCLSCAAPIVLIRSGIINYSWVCPNGCKPLIDTGVVLDESIDSLQPDESGSVEFNASHFFPPLTKSRIATAKVFMPQILMHFIECTWGGCYNALYLNILVPYLDSPQALDYVLRGPIIQKSPGSIIGKTGAQIYPELLSRLQRVESPIIKNYLFENFGKNVS